jgi:hypothetical protein
MQQPIGIFKKSLDSAFAFQAIGIDSRLKFGIVEST